MSEERGFEVVDKRRVHAEDEAQPVEDQVPAGEAAAEEEAGHVPDEAPDFSGFNPFAGITVDGILQMAASLLAERAWIDMGMVADPGTGKVEKRLEESRRAIDAFADLVPHLEANASPDEKRELQTALTNLRLNFVRQK